MDPVSLISNLVKVVKYLEKASDVVKENGRECQRLAGHMREVLTLVEVEYKVRSLPPDLIARLGELERTSFELRTLLDGLGDEPFLKRILWRDDVTKKIALANRNLQEAVQTFELGTRIDLRRFQAENEEARRRDAEAHQESLKHIQVNDVEILRVLGVQKTQMQDAMISIQRRLLRLDDRIEHRFLESGLQAMQRRSGGMKRIPDDFVITPFDINVYREKKLGEGAYAKVFQGEWRGTLVAVKMMDRGTRDDVLQKEIDVWKRLKHPHIVQFFGACLIADPPFLVSALKDGDAAHYLRRHPAADRIKLLREACTGLDYLHGYNVIHGDLKASNILIDEHGTACLADFGLSRVKTETATLTYGVNGTGVQGTARWMAPEHMARGIINKPSDIYSFGMTAFEIFTDAPPFTNIPDTLLFTLVVEKHVRPSRQDNPELGLDDDMWTLLIECWDDKPAARPLSAILVSRLNSLLMAHSRARQGANSMLPPVKQAAAHAVTKGPAEVTAEEAANGDVAVVATREDTTQTGTETVTPSATGGAVNGNVAVVAVREDATQKKVEGMSLPETGVAVNRDAKVVAFRENATQKEAESISQPTSDSALLRTSSAPNVDNRVQALEGVTPPNESVVLNALGVEDFQIINRGRPSSTTSPRKGVVVVGDRDCGRSSLIRRWKLDYFSADRPPSFYGVYDVEVALRGQEMVIELYDTSISDSVDQLRLIRNRDAQVVIICFAIDKPDSLAHVATRWIPVINQAWPGVPIVLAGLKKDVRPNPLMIPDRQEKSDTLVKLNEGLAVAKQAGASTGYYECSARTAEGCNSLLLAISAIATNHLYVEELAAFPPPPRLQPEPPTPALELAAKDGAPPQTVSSSSLTSFLSFKSAESGSRGTTPSHAKEPTGSVIRSPSHSHFQILSRTEGEDSSTWPGLQRKKVVLVGDGFCGKTALIMRWRQDSYPPPVSHTTLEKYEMTVRTQNRIVAVRLWDTGGREDYDRMRPDNYPGANVVLICFDIGQPDSLSNVTERWTGEVRGFLPSVPIVLAGLKDDRRHEPSRVEELHEYNQTPVTYLQGLELAELIGAAAYYECSAAEESDRINGLLHLITEVALSKPTKSFRFWRKK